MLINLPKDALLISSNKNTGFYVFLDIGQNILQFIFAKVVGKIMALCCLTFIYFLSDKTTNFFIPVFFLAGLVTYFMGLLWRIKLTYMKTRECQAWS